MTSYVFPADELVKLRQSLLSEGPKEAAAVILAGRAANSGRTALLVRECFPVPSVGYAVQESLRLTIRPEFLAPLLKRSRIEGWSIIFAHTHPFCTDDVRFSPTDDSGESILMPSVFSRAPSRPHASLVLGSRGFDARVWTAPSWPPESVDTIVESGSELRVHARRPSEAVPPPDEFDRSVRAFGSAGQALLKRLTVGIVGLGGIGSIVAEELAHLGVGRMILLDPDAVEPTNLNRLIGANAMSVGRPKVDIAAEHVSRIRPSIQSNAVNGSILSGHDGKALLEADLLFGCTDSHGSRAVLNQIAYQYMIPTIDLGIIINVVDFKVRSVTGRVQMLAPGLPCLVCQNLLNPEQVRRDFLSPKERALDPYIVGLPRPEPQPSVVSLNGTMASLGVTMMLAAVTGLPSPARHQVFIGERGIVRAVASSPLEDCVVCSRSGALGRGDLWPMMWRPG